jgi:hypothetical protein
MTNSTANQLNPLSRYLELSRKAVEPGWQLSADETELLRKLISQRLAAASKGHVGRVWQGEYGEWTSKCSCATHALITDSQADAEFAAQQHARWVTSTGAI